MKKPLYHVSWKEWLIMKDLSLCKDQSMTYRSEWAKRIKIDPANQTWTNAIRILQKNNIITFKPWIANFKLISIDVKKLDKFIENTNIYYEIKKYIYAKQLLVAGI